MRDVILYMSMSLDGFVGSDREHPGMAVPEGAELKQWKLDGISLKAPIGSVVEGVRVGLVGRGGSG
jgi:hypothetical protein